ncbi:MAG: glycosyltransferase family 39 protein [Anaerolineales bacterium]|nr:glycosyltransferase family 39 protein [Anaerolineales bacterium]
MKKGFIFSIFGLLLASLIWFTSGSWAYWFSFLFLWILPGLAWSQLFRSNHLDSVEYFIIGLSLNLVCTPIATLLLTYLPGPLSRTFLVIVGTANIVIPSMLSLLTNKTKNTITVSCKTRSTNASTIWNNGWIWLIAALIIAAGLRLININYSEFQGDEATVMVRAAQALEGDESIIFQHKKGPAELVIIMAGWRLTGITNEWMARLPFAYAGILGIAVIFLIGKRLSGPTVGGLASLLMSINGFFIGFGRIVQYQSLILIFCALGIFCLLVYQQNGEKKVATLATIFIGAGALAHYDIVLTIPAAIYLIGNRIWHDRKQLLNTIPPLVAAGLIGTILVGIFYIPFFKSGFLDFTSTYVSGRIGGDRLFYNHTRSFFRLSTVYNSAYIIICILLVWLVKTVSTWNRWGRLAGWLSVLLVFIAANAIYKPKLWSSDQGQLVWIPFFVLLAGAFFAPSQKPGNRALWLWFCIPALFYMFFVAVPLTHIYTLFPAMSILAGQGLVSTGQWINAHSRILFRYAILAAVGLYGLCGIYAFMLFVDHNPEYIRNWPQSKSPLFWTPYSELPDEGLFGFPYRAGWKVVGYLIDQGILVGSYDSNEEQDVTNYYTRRSLRLSCARPDMYFKATNVQDESPIPVDLVQANFRPSIDIMTNETKKLAIQLPNVNIPISSLSVESFEALFDMKTTPSRIGKPLFFDFMDQKISDFIPLDVSVGNFAKLFGFKIEQEQAAPGGYIELTLLWKSITLTNKDYHVFTHLHDGQSMIGQLDGQPVCGQYPTSQWRPGQIIIDPYMIRISQDAQPGSIVPLTTGMYDFKTMQRAVISSADGQPAGDQIFLIDITIK